MARTSRAKQALVVGLVVVVWWGTRLLTQNPQGPTGVALQAFSLWTTHVAYTKDSTALITDQQILARRGDGVSVQIGSFPVFPNVGTLRLFAYPDGRRMMVYDVIQAKTSRVGSSVVARSAWERSLHPPLHCAGLLGPEAMERDDLLGIEVYRHRRETASERATSWLAPVLGCQQVAFLLEQKNSGGWTERLEVRPDRLELEEPDPRWFTVPVGLQEMSTLRATHQMQKATSPK